MTSASRTAYVLHVRVPNEPPQVLPLTADAVTIGRASINTIVLRDSLASRFHARIEWEDGHYLLTDRGSKNGTLVDGAPVQSRVLEPGCEIRIGDAHLALQEATDLSAPFLDGDDEDTAAEDTILPDEEPSAASEPLEAIRDALQAADGELSALEDVAQQLHALVACDRATVILVEDGTGNPLMRFSHPAAESAEPLEDHVVRAGLTTDRPVALRVPAASAVLDATLGVSRHVMLVPLVADDRTLGLIALEREPKRPPFPAEDLRLGAAAAGYITSFLRVAL